MQPPAPGWRLISAGRLPSAASSCRGDGSCGRAADRKRDGRRQLISSGDRAKRLNWRMQTGRNWSQFKLWSTRLLIMKHEGKMNYFICDLKWALAEKTFQMKSNRTDDWTLTVMCCYCYRGFHTGWAQTARLHFSLEHLQKNPLRPLFIKFPVPIMSFPQEDDHRRAARRQRECFRRIMQRLFF